MSLFISVCYAKVIQLAVRTARQPRVVHIIHSKFLLNCPRHHTLGYSMTLINQTEGIGKKEPTFKRIEKNIVSPLSISPIFHFGSKIKKSRHCFSGVSHNPQLTSLLLVHCFFQGHNLKLQHVFCGDCISKRRRLERRSFLSSVKERQWRGCGYI